MPSNPISQPEESAQPEDDGMKSLNAEDIPVDSSQWNEAEMVERTFSTPFTVSKKGCFSFMQ